MDVKESKEALIAVVKLVKLVQGLAKDGLDVKDLGAVAAKIATDAEFRGALIAAVEGAAQIPAEVKDISLEEGLEIVMAIIAELKAA